jgi:alkylhydroperoxidase/carboxymuconolactone decarboxylase family protein YurZ
MRAALRRGVTKRQMGEVLAIVWILAGGTSIGWTPAIKEILK